MMNNFILLLCLTLILSACSRELSVSRSFFSPGEGVLSPSTDRLSSDCMANPLFDACVFLKNPVAQERASVSLADLDGKRRYGVKLRGLAPSGNLENKWFKVLTLDTPRFSLFRRDPLKDSYRADGSFAEQISAYYWANLTLEYLQAQQGAAAVRDLKIYADDAFTGFVAKSNSIHLEKTAAQTPRAFSGEVVIQLLGQALAQHLSNHRLVTKNPAQHKVCLSQPKGCCQTNLGCAQALSGAFGDYLAGMVYPSQPRVGETVAGDADGQELCGLMRDPLALSSRTKDQIFGACPQATGHAALMGAWYASLWWKLKADHPAHAKVIDRVYFDHAKAWTDQSTFAGAKTEAQNLARGTPIETALAAMFTAAGI
ncbi:MAG TPA: hypothetical protein PKC28_07130 [Bdellovibrionales bacterium]|nr:hypothetical protein [Bdellovibrionales bacterium]